MRKTNKMATLILDHTGKDTGNKREIVEMVEGTGAKGGKGGKTYLFANDENNQ